VPDINQPKASLYAQVDPETYELLARTAKAFGQTKASVIEEAILYYCAQEDIEDLPTWRRPVDSLCHLLGFHS